MFQQNYLKKNQINEYKNNGFIIIRNIFKPWIKTLKLGFKKVLENPGIHARENVNSNFSGRFLKIIVTGKEFMNLGIVLKNLLEHKLLLKQQSQSQFKYFMNIFLLKTLIPIKPHHGTKICHTIV